MVQLQLNGPVHLSTTFFFWHSKLDSQSDSLREIDVSACEEARVTVKSNATMKAVKEALAQADPDCP